MKYVLLCVINFLQGFEEMFEPKHSFVLLQWRQGSWPGKKKALVKQDLSHPLTNHMKYVEFCYVVGSEPNGQY